MDGGGGDTGYKRGRERHDGGKVRVEGDGMRWLKVSRVYALS